MVADGARSFGSRAIGEISITVSRDGACAAVRRVHGHPLELRSRAGRVGFPPGVWASILLVAASGAGSDRTATAMQSMARRTARSRVVGVCWANCVPDERVDRLNDEAGSFGAVNSDLR